MRHGFITDYDPKPGVSVATLAYEYPAGFNVHEHAHGSDQVIYATRGVMEVASGQTLWLIPPSFAIWIPARTLHRIRMPGAVSMRTVYLRTGMAPRLPTLCSVIHVSALLRELIVETVRLGQLRTRNRLHCALRDLLIAQFQSASTAPSLVRMPADPRALAVAQAVLDDFGESKPLAALCAAAGASVRTIERAFRKDVGTDFETWRRQVRLMRAVELLVGGASVKQVAFDVGYRQPSAFVTMFRRTFGTTPKAWVAGLDRT